MARSPSTQPTDAELGILRILWERGPSELGVICTELRRQREVATTTVATILRVMMEKGLAKRSEGANGYLWSAGVSHRATAGKMLRKLLNHVFDGSARLMMMNLIDGNVLNEQDRQELRELLEVAHQREDIDSPRGSSAQGGAKGNTRANRTSSDSGLKNVDSDKGDQRPDQRGGRRQRRST